MHDTTIPTVELPKHRPLTEINKHGSARFFKSLKCNAEVMGLVGAVVYAGRFLIRDTPKGTHAYLMCPNRRVAKDLAEQSTYLFLKLQVIFPLTRLLISTVDDPLHNQVLRFDDCVNDGAHQMLSDLFLGYGSVKDHPSWHIVVRLTEDGYMYDIQD
jgi:hypothetical protein